MPEPTTPSMSPGAIIFLIFLAALVLLLVYEYFQIQDDCVRHKMYDDWQSNFC